MKQVASGAMFFRNVLCFQWPTQRSISEDSTVLRRLIWRAYIYFMQVIWLCINSRYWVNIEIYQWSVCNAYVSDNFWFIDFFALWNYCTKRSTKKKRDKYFCLNFLVYFLKVGLCDLNAVCESPPINFWIPEPIFMKFGMYIMASEPVLTAYSINSSHQSVYPSYRC
jgi:hypothetical protein